MCKVRADGTFQAALVTVVLSWLIKIYLFLEVDRHLSDRVRHAPSLLARLIFVVLCELIGACHLVNHAAHLSPTVIQLI